MSPREDPARLAPLVELSRALAHADLRTALSQSLEILAESFRALSALVLLQEEGGGGLRVEASWGLSGPALARAALQPGEGVTGRVLKKGKAVVVPQVSREPLFLDRTGVLRELLKGKGELSFFCVPVPLDGRTAGTLSLSARYAPGRDYEGDSRILQIAAAMIGMAIKVARMVAADRQRLLEENRQLREELRERYEPRNLIGNSHAMQRVYGLVAQAAPADTTVLIRGESGTGKELIAHAIHYGSPRAAKPFVKVSCGALPEALIESELFGYEPGAFTDARKQKPGRFDLADGGTLFLDEVGELSPATQVKLLRVLQEREFERLGGTRPVKVDVRLVAATNRDLEAAILAGTFREDLYYRLNVFEVFVPPLRERSTDILLLADHFVEKFAARHRKDVRRLSTSAIDMLMAYHWPGNVRELENCIERAILVCEGGAIHGHHLPPSLQTAELSGTLPAQSLEAAVTAFERDLLQDALKSARGNRARAARLLQTTERILTYKIRKYGLDPARFRMPQDGHITTKM